MVNCSEIAAPPLWCLPLAHSPNYLSHLWKTAQEADRSDLYIPLEFETEWDSDNPYDASSSDNRRHSEDRKSITRGGRRLKGIPVLRKSVILTEPVVEALGGSSADQLHSLLHVKEGDFSLEKILQSYTSKRGRADSVDSEAGKRSLDIKLMYGHVDNTSDKFPLENDATSDTGRGMSGPMDPEHIGYTREEGPEHIGYTREEDPEHIGYTREEGPEHIGYTREEDPDRQPMSSDINPCKIEDEATVTIDDENSTVGEGTNFEVVAFDKTDNVSENIIDQLKTMKEVKEEFTELDDDKRNKKNNTSSKKAELKVEKPVKTVRELHGAIIAEMNRRKVPQTAVIIEASLKSIGIMIITIVTKIITIIITMIIIIHHLIDKVMISFSLIAIPNSESCRAPDKSFCYRQCDCYYLICISFIIEIVWPESCIHDNPNMNFMNYAHLTKTLHIWLW